MRALLLGLLCLPLAASVLAQGTDFYPLGEGDTWTYEMFSYDPVQQFDATRGLRQVVAGADTAIAGESYRLVDVTYTDYARTATSTERCAVRVAGAAEMMEWIALRGECGAVEAGIDIQSGTPATATYYVGGIAYEGAVRPLSYRATLVAGLGVVSSEAAGFGMSSRQRNRLLSATVGGLNYGATPDPAAWRTFYPLAMGDRRIVRYANRYTGGYTSYDVVGEEAVDGVTYMRVSVTPYSSGTAPVVTGTRSVLMRYRDDLGCVTERYSDGSERCLTPAIGGRITFARTAATQVAGQTVTARVIEVANGSRPATTIGSFDRYVEGVGLVAHRNWNTAGPSGGHYYNEDLLYARVGGVSTGEEPVWAVWPVAGEAAPDAAGALALRLASPNPTSGTIVLRAESTEARTVWLTVTDMLGRAVEAREATLGVGVSDVRIDLGGHAAGLYRVQMRDSRGASAAVSVTRR